MNTHPDQLASIPAEFLSDHLTPDQIDDHLIGDLAPPPPPHPPPRPLRRARRPRPLPHHQLPASLHRLE